MIIPVAEQRRFCGRAEAVKDPVASDILTALLEGFSATGSCPLADTGGDCPDAYWSEDIY